jgi:hypothetical protein
MTTNFSPSSIAACATRTGSSGSGGKGMDDSTAQNEQFLVHRSPSIMNVAVLLEKHLP